MWAAEDVIGEIEPVTGTLIEERRTDIVYGWNDSTREIKVVFEFKRLRRRGDVLRYLGDEGLRRFVTGIYSRRQALAAMVGVLLDPRKVIVQLIMRRLGDATVARTLRLQTTASGKPFLQPSLFSSAEFDTEHARHPALAPSHGTIRVAHMFWEFGY